MAASTNGALKVHQITARTLADNGVDTMFGLLGDANMFMANSFINDCGGTYVAAAHEAAATLMALGYAQISGKVGICTVTHGPAMTNTVTPLVEGVKGQVPIVLLCGDTPVLDRENNQNVAQREFVIAAGGGFEQIRSPKTVAEDVARALRRAVAERRPIALNMPLEFDWQDADYTPMRVQIPESRAIVSASEDLDNAIGVIAAARRPLMLVGRGAVSADARAAILRLAKRIEAPLATTLKGKDLFLGEDYNLGICGLHSTPGAVDVIMECDCIIALGSSLNYRTFSRGTFLKGKRLIQINLEPSEIGKNRSPDVGMVGDPAGVADLIVHWLDEAEIPPSGWYSEELRQKIAAAAPTFSGKVEYDDGSIDFRQALLRLDQVLPANRLLVTDGGRNSRVAWTRIRTDGPGSFLPTSNFSSIGLGMSHAIGAAFARPEQPIVLVNGDGGFMHGGVAEFNTAVRYKRDLIVIVGNDGAYGSEVIKFKRHDVDSASVLFDWPDFAPLAIALGGAGVTLRSGQDLPQVEAAIANRSGPLLIDVKCRAYRDQD